MSEEKTSAGIIIDFGNSETRVCSLHRASLQEIVRLSNAFAQLPDDYVVPDQYTSGPLESIVFDAPASLADDAPIVRFAAGPIVEREFAVEAIRPTATSRKYAAHATLLSFRYALYVAQKQIAAVVKRAVGNLHVTWDVTILAPATETSRDHADMFRALFTKTDSFTVSCPSTLTIPIDIDSLTVRPEGMMAFAALAFTNGTPASERSKYADSKILVIDVGAGTTDLTFIDQMQPVAGSYDSYPIGGNNIASRVANLIDLKLGRRVSRHALEEALSTGYLTSGASKRDDITPLIESATRETVAKAAAQIKQTFTRITIDPQELNYVLIVGGGSLPRGKADTSFAEAVVEELRSIAPYIELFPYSSTDVRLLNIRGAANAARVKLAKTLKAKK